MMQIEAATFSESRLRHLAALEAGTTCNRRSEAALNEIKQKKIFDKLLVKVSSQLMLNISWDIGMASNLI